MPHMTRRLFLLAASLITALALAAPPAQAGPVEPFNSHPHGHSYQSWLQMVGQWFLGDSSNPLFAGLEGDCGELMNGVFFMVAPIDVGEEFNCSVPTGRPIVLSHAGFFASVPIDGQTDQDLLDAVDAGFTLTSNALTLDGVALPLHPINTGAYDVISEPGSFYDAVLDLGTGPIRTAVKGDLVFLHPLKPGDHEINAEVLFTNGDHFSAAYHVHVGH